MEMFCRFFCAVSTEHTVDEIQKGLKLQTCSLRLIVAFRDIRTLTCVIDVGSVLTSQVRQLLSVS